MASTSVSGIGYAAPIMALAVLTAAAEPVRADQGASSGSASLDITVRGIKSAKGVIRLAICPQNAGFPDCTGREVRSASMPIQNGEATIRFTDLPAANYAVSVFHDVNANGKLDTFLGIPKEGYGFSRNPPFRPRAPRFTEVELLVSGAMTETITLRYIF